MYKIKFTHKKKKNDERKYNLVIAIMTGKITEKITRI